MPVSATQYLNVTAAGLNPKSDAKSTLDKDGFLKLLTAQLKNQDPQSSQDPTEYFNTITQMTVVEQLTNLSGNSNETLKQQQAANLTSMIGKTVSYLDKTGTRVSGALESVQLGKDGATATIAGVAGITPSVIVEIQ